MGLTDSSSIDSIGATNKGLRGCPGHPKYVAKLGKKGPKLGLFGMLSFMKIPLVSPSLDQNDPNSFGHPQIHSSIAPMIDSDRII